MITTRVKFISFWPLLLPLIIFLRNPTGFPYPNPDAIYSDISISHYPNIIYLKKIISEYHIVPLWSPLIYGGTPFAANPLSGLWYPPGWFAIIFPLPFGINLTAGLHLLWGGIGLYRLLSDKGLSHRSSLFGALVFMSTPKIFAHYGAGHLTLIYAISWTPWLFVLDNSTHRKRVKGSIGSSVILALIILADPRWAVYSGGVWVIHTFTLGRFSILQSWNHSGQKMKQGFGILVRLFSGFGFQVFTAFFLACPLLVPLLEYSQLSTRAMMLPEETTIFSLSFTNLLGMFYPNYGGNHELTIYLGSVALVLLLVGLTRNRKTVEERFWILIIFFSLVLAFGDNLPGYSQLNRLPVFRLMRVPSRSLFVMGFSAAIVLAYTVEHFLKPDGFKPRHRILLAMTGLTSLSLMMAFGIYWISKENSPEIIMGAGVTLITSLIIGFRYKNNITPHILYLILLALALLDLSVFNLTVLSYRSKEDVLNENKQVVEYLGSEYGDYRVYSPSYSIPQQTIVHNQLEMVSGVDPLILAPYSTYLSSATGIPSGGYSVTIPPFQHGNPAEDNRGYTPNSRLLGLVNVKYVVSEFNLEADGLVLEEKFGNSRVYRNELALPRAWIQPIDFPIGEGIVPTTKLIWNPNHISVDASGPGLLVLSEIYYPGWQVRVDGEPSEIKVVNTILRAVVLNEGEHIVNFYLNSTSIYLGLVCFLLGVILVGIYLWKQKYRHT